MTAGKPATRRINRGSGHSYLLDGTRCDGVTSILSGGIPKPALVGWAAKAVAEFVANNRTLVMGLDDAALVDLCKGAPYRDRDQAARRGTEVHYLASELNRGAKIEVPSELVGPVDAYMRWLEEWRPKIELVEVTVINRRYRYAGTLDLIASITDCGDTERWLIDIKTSRSGPFGEVGLQTIAYGRAESYIGEDQAEHPMPQIDAYGVLWLTADSYEFYGLDVGEREWRAFLFAQQINRWVEERSKLIVGPPLERPIP